MNPSLKETLNIWDIQLVSFGSKIIERRKSFVNQLNEIIFDIHKNLSGGKEHLEIKYARICQMINILEKNNHITPIDIFFRCARLTDFFYI